MTLDEAIERGIFNPQANSPNEAPDKLDAAKREIAQLRQALAAAKAQNVEFHRELVKLRTPCRHKYDPARAEDRTECGHYVPISNNFSHCPHCGRSIIPENT